jgi:3-deoxy-D-manno-octulosonic-acid transferase
VFEIVSQTKQIDIFSDFTYNDKTIVAGSTWTKDEILLSQLLENHDFRLVIAPHEVHSERIEEIKKRFSDYNPIQYSQLLPHSDLKQIQVIIIDVIGILSSLYRYGNIAYIGGGFGKGIHNILEAATYGKPLIFGPKYKKFKEANDLVRLSAAFPVSNYTDLDAVIHQLYSSPQQIEHAGMKAKQYVLDNVGACKRIYRFVFEKA